MVPPRLVDEGRVGGDCLFRVSGPPALFRFKDLAYGRQENLSVSGVDELAITSAEAEGVSRTDFLGCYLREESFGRVRKDIEEGYRLGVNSTPTYFVDGTRDLLDRGQDHGGFPADEVPEDQNDYVREMSFRETR